MVQFFETVMGRRFYESNVPRIAKALEKIGAELERLNNSNDSLIKEGSILKKDTVSGTEAFILPDGSAIRIDTGEVIRPDKEE